ncbi:MAG: CBS domain-containing protein [Desulforhopalus sp.]
MKKYGRVKQAIKRKFPMIDIEDSLGKAIQTMAENNVSVLAVKIGKELAGIVTISDVMHGLANDDNLETTRISTFMTQCKFDTEESTQNSCLQLDEEEDIISAIKVMHEAGVNHLLVTGVENEPLGIVSSLELVKLVAAGEE